MFIHPRRKSAMHLGPRRNRYNVGIDQIHL
jgi:hypothetical protein